LASFNVAIFDMDGLLLDSERPIQDAWIRVSAASGIALEAATYRQVVGLNARDSRAHLTRILGERLSFEDGVRQVAEELENAFAKPGYPLKPGAKALLDELKRRSIRCAVASSSDRSEIESRLAKAGVLDHFAAIAAGNEVTRGKPAPDIFLLARERLGMESSASCLVFEDSEPGAKAALAAGMSVVVVPDLRPPHAAILNQCLMVLDSLDDAVSHCDAWFELT
jgi:HAD superfamily hydrolase (TIGR01509 family)